jgi:hypothetical protein
MRPPDKKRIPGAPARDLRTSTNQTAGDQTERHQRDTALGEADARFAAALVLLLHASKSSDFELIDACVNQAILLMQQGFRWLDVSSWAA